MTRPVLQSLLVDHIWMLLLFQRISGKGQVLMILYLIMNHLYDASLVLEEFSSWSSIPPIKKKFKLSFIVVFFQMVHNEKFSEGPMLSIEPFQKVQLEVIYFFVIRKNEKPP